MTYKNINVVTKFSFLRREQLNFKVSSHHYKNSLVVMLFTYLFIYTYLYRSGGRPEVFCRKDVLKISQNSQESTCARSSFLIKLLIIDLRLRDMFSWEFCKFLTMLFYIEHFRWLLLFIDYYVLYARHFFMLHSIRRWD